MAAKTMKFITTQLKEMTEKLPSEILEGESFTSLNAQVESFLEMIGPQEPGANSSFSPHIVHGQHNQSIDGNVNTPGVQEIQQNADGTPTENNGSSTSDITEGAGQSGTESISGSPKSAREVIEQFEPGVYVTLLQLSDGSKIFKRVKFSKRRFVEHQAEEWWKKNKDRLLQKYNTPKANSTLTESSGGAEAAEENSTETPQTS